MQFTKLTHKKLKTTKMCNDDNVLWQFKKTKNNFNFSGRQISSLTFCELDLLGKGQNYKNHNVENQKELRKLRRRSEHRKN